MRVHIIYKVIIQNRQIKSNPKSGIVKNHRSTVTLLSGRGRGWSVDGGVILVNYTKGRGVGENDNNYYQADQQQKLLTKGVGQ